MSNLSSDDAVEAARTEILAIISNTPVVDLVRPTADRPKRPSVSVAPVEPFRPFPTAMFAPVIARFVGEVAAATSTDPAFAAIAVLVLLAGCIGNRVLALVKKGWAEPAVLWGTLVGKSGMAKSPVLKLVSRALVEIYKSERANYLAAAQEYERANERYMVDLATWKREQRTGPPTDPPEKPEAPNEKRILVSDITIEKLVALLNDNPLGLLLMRDELAAWIGMFDRYSAGGKGSDQPAFLSMYDAGAIINDRKGGGTNFVERGAVSILGGIQPRTLARLFGRAEREAGLLARVLLAYPPDKPAFFTDDELSDESADAWRKTLEALLAMPSNIDDGGKPRPRVLPLSVDGKARYRVWHDQHVSEMAAISDEDLLAHFVKLKGGCIRIALILAVTDVATQCGPATHISVDAVERAITITEWFKNEARRVYSSLAEDDDVRAARQLADLIDRKGGRITPRELQQSDRRFRDSSEAAESALQELVDAGLGEWALSAPSPKGGPASRVFVLRKPASVYGTPLNTEENMGSVDVDNVDTQKSEAGEAPSSAEVGSDASPGADSAKSDDWEEI